MTSAETPSALPAFSRNLIVVLLIAGAFVSVLNQTLMLVAITPIMVDFHIDAGLAQWVTTAFMLASGVCIPVSAALIDRYSSRTLYLFALGIFLVGTVIGALAHTFTLLLIARVVQGASAGLIMPLIQTLLMSLFPPQKRGRAMGLVGLVIAFAPAMGPSLSGWIVDQFSWRYLFIILIPAIALVWMASMHSMVNVTRQRDTRIDFWSVVLSTLGWGGLLYGFSIAGTVGWGSLNVLLAIGVGSVSLWVFVLRQRRLPRPLLNMAVFQSTQYRMTTLLSVLVFTLLIGTQTLIPIYAQNALSLSALHAGLLLLPGAVLMGLASPLAGALFDRFGIRGLAIGGFTLLIVAMLLLSRVSPAHHPGWLVLMSSLHMLGVTTMMMPLITAGINAVPHELIAHATAMNNTLRMVGASIGTALLVTIMSMGRNSAVAAGSELALATGIRWAFSLALGLAIVGVVLSLRLKDR
ncbi:MAG: MDR family MFS transporter [Saccharospirillum sp.]